MHRRFFAYLLLWISLSGVSLLLSGCERQIREAGPQSQLSRITIYADQPNGKLRPIWNNFGYDEALTTLTPEGEHLLAELARLHPGQPVRIRVHHLLTSGDGTLALKWSSTNVYTEDEAGNPVYDWSLIDKIMDALTRPGLEPFVQAGFMPKALSSRPDPYTPKLTQHGMPDGMVEGGAFYPPKDYKKWEALIEAWVRHCKERYGEATASSWLWEVWNEPESPYWRGTPEEFFTLYDHFAAAVKRVLPNARVGGPHVTGPGWKHGDLFMIAFLEHCRSGVNAATGRRGAPLDFIAFHAKGTTRLDEEGRVEMNLRNQLQTIDTYGKIIASFPEFKDLPIFLGESDPEGCAGCPATLSPERDYRRTSQFAAYTAATFMRKQDLMARTGGDLQGAVSWAFTFHDQPWFNGLRALTTHKVALPVFNAFKLFAQLEEKRVRVTNPDGYTLDELIAHSVRGGRADIGAVAVRGEQRLQVLLWHYHDVAGNAPDAEIKLVIEGLPEADSLHVSRQSVDSEAGNSYTAWLAMGSPQNPTAEQIDALHKAASLKRIALGDVTRNKEGLTLNITLPRQSVSLLEFIW